MKLLLCLFAVMAATMADDEKPKDILKEANQKFTARMFTEVVKQHPGKSVVLSAFSVLTPLAQLSLATEGESHDELLRAIGMPNDNSTKEVFTSLTKNVRNIKGVDLKMANKVYIPVDYELSDQFAAVTKDVFDSEVQNVNFVANVEAAKTINTWVEDHTNKRIKDLVDPDSLNSDTRAVLVNAIYFKGSWKSKFDKELTKNKPFHVSKDKTIDIPFMYKESDFLYAYSVELNAQLLQIPYKGDEASFLIVLPRDVDGLPALLEKLKDPVLLQNAIDKMRSVEVSVFLPKFKIETKTNLKDTLIGMDVKKIFDAEEARLTGLLKQGGKLYVSEATQKAFIEVNEDGAEAAAGNEVRFTHMRVPPQCDINRPFYFELRNKNEIIFNGAFVQP